MKGDLIFGEGVVGELRQPRSFDEWREAKRNTFEELRKILFGSVAVAESVLNGFLDLQVAAQPMNPNDDRVLLKPMLMSAHRGLLNSMQLLLEGQFLEAFAIFRPSAELAGHALKMSRDVKLVRVWLNRDKDEKSFDKAFKPHLPKDDSLTAGLFKLWDMASDTGMHANAKMIIFHFEQDDKGLATRYFFTDIMMLQKIFIHFIHNATSILKIYATGFGLYFGKDFMPIVQGAIDKVQDHVNSYSRQILVEAEEDAREEHKARAAKPGGGS